MKYSPSTILKAAGVGVGALFAAYMTATNGGHAALDVFQWLGIIGSGLMAAGATAHTPEKSDPASATVLADQVKEAVAAHGQLTEALAEITSATGAALPAITEAVKPVSDIVVRPALDVEELVRSTIARAQAATTRQLPQAR